MLPEVFHRHSLLEIHPYRLYGGLRIADKDILFYIDTSEVEEACFRTGFHRERIPEFDDSYLKVGI